ncbi:MAG: hypothetical protein ACFCU4_05945 [Puniceicoccaceae bacterium]
MRRIFWFHLPLLAAAILTVDLLTRPVLALEEDREGSSYPMVVLTNGLIEMEVYLPDSETGVYRGPRFDWSGIVGRLEWEGYRFFDFRPKAGHQPTRASMLGGPAGEFGMEDPSGYETATVGETFLKIGVGHLEKRYSGKEGDTRYRFNKHYEIKDGGVWTSNYGSDWVESIQVLSELRGYAYEYRKVIELLPDRPGFKVLQQLTNTGSLPIETSHYNHNFVVFDGKPLAPPLRALVPFEFAEDKSLGGKIQLSGREISVLEETRPGKGYYHREEFSEETPTAGFYAGQFIDPEAGKVLSFSGDQAPYQYTFYALGNTISLEPFIKIKVSPGETLEWTTLYELSALSEGTEAQEIGDLGKDLGPTAPAQGDKFQYTDTLRFDRTE